MVGAVAALALLVPDVVRDAQAIDISAPGLTSRQPVLRIGPRPAPSRAPAASYYPSYWYNSPFQFSRTGRDERGRPRVYCGSGGGCEGSQ